MKKWSDYKDVLSASYSEKYFTENRQELLQAAERVGRRQYHFLIWFYVATIGEALLFGATTLFYGGLRRVRLLGRLIDKIVIPGISEWHAMFTTFTFSRWRKRTVQVDALLTDGNLYQGGVGDFHVDSDGRLSGFLMKKARRFLRAEYHNDQKEKKAGSKEKYWREIPGESLYLLANKISNLNFSYPPDKRLDELARDDLKKMNIEAGVTIESAPVKVDKFEAPKSLGETQEEKKVAADKLEAETAEAERAEIASLKNFRICRHCLLNGRPAQLPRITSVTPLVSRSDGKSYHIYLQLGPKPQLSMGGEIQSELYLAHFRYALDARNIINDPVSVVIRSTSQGALLIEEVETVADLLAKMLEMGKTPAMFYQYSQKKLTELMVKPKPKK